MAYVWNRRLANLLLICLVVLAVIPVQAQDERATVRVDGRTVFRVGPADDVDAETRARRIEQRLNTLLENPLTIAPSVVEANRANERLVTISGVPIVTITETDAQDNLTTVDALAVQWSQATDRVLTEGRERRQSAGWQVQILVESAFARLIESVTAVVPRVLAALLILAFFGTIAWFVRMLMRGLFRRLVSDLTVENLIKQVVYYAIWTLGIVVAINALGFDPEAVATGIGLTSLALGFALQDILSNFISGLLILLLRPFKLGDQIVIGDTEGGVERINLRATQIRTYDGRVILVPNAELFTSRITNNTAAPVRRSAVDINVGYDAELDKIAGLLLEAAQASAGVLSEPPVSIRVRELRSSDIVVEVRFWTDSRRSDYLATTSNVRKAVVLALKQAGYPPPNPGERTLIPGQIERWQSLLSTPSDSPTSG